MKKTACYLIFLLILPLELFGSSYRASLSGKYLWKSKTIPVCWENPTPNNLKGRSWTKEGVQSTWQRYSALKFTGWDRCRANSRGIRILIADTGPHTKGLGTRLKGVKNGMVLNFTFSEWSQSCQNRREYCIRVIAIHEFGHALSFAHEQNRGDTPSWCNETQGSTGDINIGVWDKHSVMNYCNPKWSNNGVLSATDIEALQQFYNKPTPKDGFRVELKTNFGRKDIIFEEGDRVEFLVKLSHSGFFYIVGHTKNSEGELSYLFDFSETRGKPNFLYQVLPQEANRWISLGKFRVSEPFGFESLQVVASESEIVKLPPRRYQQTTGLFVIAKQVNRGIKIAGKYKPVGKKRARTAETILMIETRPLEEEDDDE